MKNVCLLLAALSPDLFPPLTLFLLRLLFRQQLSSTKLSGGEYKLIWGLSDLQDSFTLGFGLLGGLSSSYMGGAEEKGHQREKRTWWEAAHLAKKVQKYLMSLNWRDNDFYRWPAGFLRVVRKSFPHRPSVTLRTIPSCLHLLPPLIAREAVGCCQEPVNSLFVPGQGWWRGGWKMSPLL